MYNYFTFFLIMFMAPMGTAQVCPTVNYPVDGATDIPVDATITWTAVEGINGYTISLGTSPGGTDIVNSKSIGLDNFYSPPLGFPEMTELYVTINLIPFDAPPIVCSGNSFTTTDVTTAPPCTKLIAPDDNAANVTIVTDIIWAYAPTATGYRLSMGTSPNGIELVNNLDVGNTLLYNPPDDLPQGIDIFVTIIPYNENGEMGTCLEENFSTGAEAFDCDPVMDTSTGEMIYLKPQIDFPNLIGFCADESPFLIRSTDIADGFRWFRTNEGSAETLISESNELQINEPGRYRYEAYNNIIVNDRIVECSDFMLFNVVASGIAVIETVRVENVAGGQTITVIASGMGQYEYALDNEEGPYQDSPVFENIPLGAHTTYVRDKNGCGIISRSVDRNLSVKDFPAFFTPNTDGINDFWQFVPPPENFEFTLVEITIYDRYGNLLKQLDPESRGWDGNFNGRALPSADYWFRAIFNNQKEVLGHFSLKR